MKKLMIACAAVAMTACASASSVYWGFSSMVMDAVKYADAKNLTAGQGAGYAAYLVWANNWNASDVAGSISKAAITSVVADWNMAYDFPSSNYSQYEITQTMATLAEGTFGDISGTRSENVKDFFLVITDGSDYAAYATTAEIFDGNMRDDEVLARGMVYDFDGFGREYMAKGDFSPIAPVPEPTSGLLLLLGVAGLALRRRRS